MAAKSKLTADSVAEARRNIRRGSTKAAEAVRLGVSPRALSFAFERFPTDVPPAAASPTRSSEEFDETEDPTEAAELGVSDDMSTAEQRATVVAQLRQAEKARDELLASGDLAESRLRGARAKGLERARTFEPTRCRRYDLVPLVRTRHPQSTGSRQVRRDVQRSPGDSMRAVPRRDRDGMGR